CLSRGTWSSACRLLERALCSLRASFCRAMAAPLRWLACKAKSSLRSPPPPPPPGVPLAARGTLAFGAVPGPEMPLIALGMVVGLAVTPILRLGKQESALLAGAGAFSAISALFGGPIDRKG